MIHAFTKKYGNVANCIITPISIVNPFTGKKVQTQGIWDTGATGSVITESLARELGLIEIQKTFVQGVHGRKEVPVYRANIALNKDLSIQSLVTECSELSGDGSVGVLIGMNVIGNGDFAISNFQGRTTFTFQIPSTHNFDFYTEHKNREEREQLVRDANSKGKKAGRNEPCPCNTGKKYKNCCGNK